MEKEKDKKTDAEISQSMCDALKGLKIMDVIQPFTAEEIAELEMNRTMYYSHKDCSL